MFVESVLLVAGLLLTLYRYLTRNFSYWKSRGIAYEEPVPIFGNLWKSVVLRRNAAEIAADVYRKHPNEKVVGMYHFDSPVLLVRDPELVHKVFVTDFDHFVDNGMTVDESVDPVFARNIFFQKGEKWRRTRQMISPAFTTGKIKAVFDGFVAVAERFVEYVEGNAEGCELKSLVTRYTTEVVASCAMGIDGRGFAPPKPPLVRIGELIFEPGLVNGIVQLIVLLLPSVSRIFRIKMVPKEVPDFFNGVIGDVIKHRQENPGAARPDLLQYWIDLKRKSAEVAKGNVKSDVLVRELTDDDILGGCLTFFVEGYESMSLVTSFALHYLALNQDIQARLKEDIDDLYARHDGKLTQEGVNEIPLLNNIVHEVLRLHPALLQSLKTCTKSYAMDVGKSKPLIVEKGIIVVVSVSALGNDPRYWNHPEKFDPDRFAESGERSKGTYMPFGDGPRICIGIRIAHTVVKTGLIHVVKNFRVVPTERTPLEVVQDPRHFISRSKGGLYVKFVKRAQGE